jgi:hypothetical protein
LALTAFYVWTERGRPEPAPLDSTAGRERAPLMVAFPAGPTRLELQAEGRTLGARRTGGAAWEVVEPPGSRVPPDLVAAVVAAVTDQPDFEVVSAAAPATAAEFGLAAPQARLTLADDDRSVTLLIGARNPAQTAVYAQREGGDEVVLLGLNVQYYVDLVMQTLERMPG